MVDKLEAKFGRSYHFQTSKKIYFFVIMIFGDSH